MTPEDKKLWGEAAVKGWMAYIDNEAIEVLSMEESRRVRAELARKSELDRILVPRFVCTDKNDGLRSSSSNLPVRHSARMVVPGFKDRANLEGSLRRDAPIGSRTAQHLLLIIAYSCMEPYMVFDLGRRQGCLSERDRYVSRQLWITKTNEAASPPVPVRPGQLAKVVKGIFGLADAPRQWWLRLFKVHE